MRLKAHLEGLLAQSVRIVTQRRGLFELEVLGVAVHAPLQVIDAFGELRRRHPGILICLLGHFFRTPRAARPATTGTLHDVGNGLLNAARDNTVFGVECELLLTTTLGFIQSPAHRPGHSVRIQNRGTVDIARRPANGLNQRAIGAQKAFLVGVEDCHQRYLWHVQALAQ